MAAKIMAAKIMAAKIMAAKIMAAKIISARIIAARIEQSRQEGMSHINQKTGGDQDTAVKIPDLGPVNQVQGQLHGRACDLGPQVTLPSPTHPPQP